MKAERFIYDLASYRRKEFQKLFKLYHNSAVLDCIEKVDKLVSLRERGIISALECAKLLSSDLIE